MLLYTVKTHERGVYRKPRVEDRSRAVIAAEARPVVMCSSI